MSISKDRANTYKRELARLIKEEPKYRKVKSRYELMRIVLEYYYPILTSSVTKEALERFLRETIYVDRQIRNFTEGEDGETKDILSQEFILNEGYEVGYPHPKLN